MKPHKRYPMNSLKWRWLSLCIPHYYYEIPWNHEIFLKIPIKSPFKSPWNPIFSIQISEVHRCGHLYGLLPRVGRFHPPPRGRGGKTWRKPRGKHGELEKNVGKWGKHGRVNLLGASLGPMFRGWTGKSLENRSTNRCKTWNEELGTSGGVGDSWLEIHLWLIDAELQ